MTRILILIAVILTACTPAEVQSFADDVGFPLQPGEAEYLADWLDRDCLPRYNHDDYLECGVADAWEHYRLAEFGVSLKRWADVAWCESRFDEDVVNRSSNALGLYQHLGRYWPDRAARAGWDDDWSNPRTNAFVSGWLARLNGGLRDWAPSRHCWSSTP